MGSSTSQRVMCIQNLWSCRAPSKKYSQLSRTLEEDPSVHILVMHQVWMDYQATVHLHDLPAGMLSRQGQMGELQLESFEGMAICLVKEASEQAIIRVSGLITGRSFDLHMHDQPMSDPMDTGCPSPGKALLLPAAPSTPLQHDSPIDIRLPLQICWIPSSQFLSLHHQSLRRNRLSWMGPPVCQSGKKQVMSLTSSSRTIPKRNKKTPSDICYKHRHPIWWDGNIDMDHVKGHWKQRLLGEPNVESGERQHELLWLVLSHCITLSIDFNQYIPGFVFKSFTNLYQNGENEPYCLQFVVLSHCIELSIDFNQYIPIFVSNSSLICTKMAEINHIVWDSF